MQPDSVVDVHIHYSPRKLLEERLGSTPSNARQVRYEGGLPASTLNPQLYDLDRHLLMMDAAGVDVAVLSSPEGWTYDLERCRAVNNAHRDAMASYGGRIIGMAHTDPFDLKEGYRELDRALGDLGLKGVALTSSIKGRGLDDPELRPFYEKVQRLGAFVFIHPSLSCDGSCFSPQGFEAYDLYRTLGREYDLLSAIVRLVCGGVLDDFPELKIVIGHVGGAISPLLGRIRGYQDKDSLGIADDPVHGRTAQREFDYYLTRLYFDTGGHFGDITAIQAALLNIPSSQIMFGTDYPQEIRDEATVARFLADLRALDLSAEAIAGILGENARAALFAD